jgi:hypothetical protein
LVGSIRRRNSFRVNSPNIAAKMATVANSSAALAARIGLHMAARRYSIASAGLKAE